MTDRQTSNSVARASSPCSRRRRAIFLDFDGVLSRIDGPPGYTLPFEFVPNLDRILEPWPDVAIAVHSSWRETFSANDLREFLGPLGVRFIGATSYGSKATGIQQFLAEHQDLSDYLVLDDSAEEFSDGRVENVIICNPTFGLAEPVTLARIEAWLLSNGCRNAVCN